MKWHGDTSSKMLRLVMATYGWQCHLCGLPIDPDAKPRTPEYMSADHLIPRSMGGTHTLDNLRPAHMGCNARRGNKPIKRPARRAWQSNAWQ